MLRNIVPKKSFCKNSPIYLFVSINAVDLLIPQYAISVIYLKVLK